MLVRRQRFYEGAAAARRALTLEPYAPNAWATLAASELGAGNGTAAAASARRALDLLADYPYALFIEARAAEAIGDGARAEGSWSRLRALADGRAPTAMDPETAEAARVFLSQRNR